MRIFPKPETRLKKRNKKMEYMCQAMITLAFSSENKREIERRPAKRQAKESILLTVGCSSRWIKETGLRGRDLCRRSSLVDKSFRLSRLLSAYYTQTVGLIDATTRLTSNEPPPPPPTFSFWLLR